jgi:hypothetical protein
MPDGMVNTIAASKGPDALKVPDRFAIASLSRPSGADILKRFLGGECHAKVCISIFLIFTSAPSAFATELPKEGSYDYTACWSGVNNVITFSKTYTASSYEMTGANNAPGGMFDKNTFCCVGMNASLDGKTTGSTVCEAIDADGDKRLAYFSLASDGKLTREKITGTGRYGCNRHSPTLGAVSGRESRNVSGLQSSNRHL